VLATSNKRFAAAMRERLVSMGIPEDKIVDGGEARVFLTPYLPGAYYSQFGEDLVVKAVFGWADIKKPGYIDIGAHHPYIGSNTALLYLNGSRGINVEANPLIEEFRRERPEDVTLNVGVSDQKGILKFYRLSDDGDSGDDRTDTLNSQLNTFDLDWVKTCLAQNPFLRINDVIEMPVVTIPEIIEQHCGGRYPEYMSIDIEGYDYQALSVCDFTEDGPLLITVEANNGEIGQKIYRLLSEQGYLPYAPTSGRMDQIHNLTYIRKTFYQKLW
jgi:FkbM family methyltransferase